MTARTSTPIRFAAVTVMVLLLAGPGPARGQSEAESLSASFRKAARRVLPAVVTVHAADEAAVAVAPGELVPIEPLPREGGGSGVLIDAARGYVLTNDHVVRGRARLFVALADGRARPVLRVRSDPRSDLALLAFDPEGLELTQASWGDSDGLEIGDWVLAVGQPFGLPGTVTAGIVSGIGRGVGPEMFYEDLIQTDAAINPGNSGGPLVNLRGEVVGITAALKSVNGGSEGVGFAVPAVRARRVAAELAEFGRVRRAYLGVSIGRLDPATRERVGRPGVVVTSVLVGGPGAEAGLRPGDVIVALAGRPVTGPGMVQARVETAPVGEPLPLTLLRGGASVEVPVRPGLLPEPPAAAPLPAPRTAPAPAPSGEPLAGRTTQRFPDLGLRLAEPTEELARRFGLDPSVRGLVVVGVEPGSPADGGGLDPGMVLTDAAHRRVGSLADFRASLADRPAGSDLIVRVIRAGRAEFRILIGGGRP